MGLLDGDLQRVFGNVFGPLLLDGTLHKRNLTHDEGGSVTTGASTDHPVKGMAVAYDARLRAQAGIPDTDVQIILMQLGVAAAPTLDDEVSLTRMVQGVAVTQRWTIKQPIEEDPAAASWTMRGVPVT